MQSIHTAKYPNRLRDLIKEAGYTIREVSQEVEIPESTLRDWVAGNRPIPHNRRTTIAQLLGCPFEALTDARISFHHLLQYNQDSSKDQQGYDMDRKRRLILRAMSVAGAAFVAPFERLLDIEPWKKIADAATRPSSLDSDALLPFHKLTEVCWKMSNGSELETVAQLLPTYLPQISTLAQQPSKYQHAAAKIAAQGYLLSYVVASNHEDFQLAFSHCQKARTYAQAAHDPNLEAISLIRQGVIGLYRKRPYQSLEAYEEALQYVGKVSPLIRTRLYASLCEIQGKLGMEQEARKSIGLAQESFPEDVAGDPASTYIHFSKSGIHLHEGLALLDLHKPDEALDRFLRIDGLRPKLEISERSRIDVLNQQALASGVNGDLDQFQTYITEAVASGRKLGSDLRVSESWDIYSRLTTKYPREPQINSLHTLFAQ